MRFFFLMAASIFAWWACNLAEKGWGDLKGNCLIRYRFSIEAEKFLESPKWLFNIFHSSYEMGYSELSSSASLPRSLYVIWEMTNVCWLSIVILLVNNNEIYWKIDMWKSVNKTINSLKPINPTKWMWNGNEVVFKFEK